MEISLMVADLKTQIIAAARELKEKESLANSYREKIKKLEAEIDPLKDRFDAMKMAVESLELISPKATVQETIASPEPQYVVQLTADHPIVKSNNRKPMRIEKFDPKGKKISEYRSINELAKDMGWSNTSLKKYIESTSKEKQIRLRGYYLAFAA